VGFKSGPLGVGIAPVLRHHRVVEGPRCPGDAQFAAWATRAGGSPFDALLRHGSAAPADQAAGAAETAVAGARRLDTCRVCGSRLVQLERCREISGTEYEVALRCPECGVRESLEVLEPLVLAYDARAEEAEAGLRALLRVVTRARVAAEIDAFRRAVGD